VEVRVNTAFNQPAVELSTADFPIAWPTFGDSLLHWIRDERRGPEPLTRFEASVLAAIDEAGFAALERRYELPVRPRRAAFNGWVYGAYEPVVRDSEAAARLTAMADHRLSLATAHMQARWRTSWEPELRRIWGRLEAVDPERLTHPVLLARFDHGVSLAEEAGRIAADVSLQAAFAVEEGRFHADSIARETHIWSSRLVPFALRRIALAVGRVLERQGRIDRAADVAHVSIEELRTALRLEHALHSRVDAGRRERDEFSLAAPPPTVGTALDRATLGGRVGRAAGRLIGEPMAVAMAQERVA
jgi:hypothetical protein